MKRIRSLVFGISITGSLAALAGPGQIGSVGGASPFSTTANVACINASSDVQPGDATFIGVVSVTNDEAKPLLIYFTQFIQQKKTSSGFAKADLDTAGSTSSNRIYEIAESNFVKYEPSLRDYKEAQVQVDDQENIKNIVLVSSQGKTLFKCPAGISLMDVITN